MQQLFRKLLKFNSLSVALATLAGYALIRALPAIPPRLPAELPIRFERIAMSSDHSEFRVAGTWRLLVDDPRLQGVSGLAYAAGHLVAVTDLGAAIRFDPPGRTDPRVLLVDLEDGPGPYGRKKNRDAEAVSPDGQGGWYVAFENHHSVWRFDSGFRRGSALGNISRPSWTANGGIEALVATGEGPLALAQSGQETLHWIDERWRGQAASLGWQVADAAIAPDGSTWVLLRSISFGGFDEAIAPLRWKAGRAVLGPVTRFPKRPFDNFEGMAIEQTREGWRLWLVSDDGHYLWPHTILMALDLRRTQENARR